MRHVLIPALFLMLMTASGIAQNQVYPGDANANGRVDHYDILPIGFAYGEIGPARIEAGDGTALQEIAQNWENEYPTGVNYIHADANGNGLVEFTDFFLVHTNYGAELSEVTPLVFPEVTPLTSPAIMVNQGATIEPLMQSTVISFPISIESVVDGNGINGIAFEVEFEETHFAEFSFQFSDEWLNEDGQAYTYKRSGPGKISVALSRFGDNPVEGGGDIGVLSLVIIEDLINLLEQPDDTLRSKVKINNILSVGAGYTPIGIAEDSLELRLFQETVSTLPTLSNDLQARIFPNPSSGPVTVLSTYPFHTLQCINSAGKIISLAQNKNQTIWENHLDLPTGQYWIRVVGLKGESLLPLIITP